MRTRFLALALVLSVLIAPSGFAADSFPRWGVGVDKATGKPYVGYASMPGEQSGQNVLAYRYGNDFNRFEDQPDVIYSGYGQEGKATARGLEQRYFEQRGGLEGTANKQNPVSLKNPRRGEYLRAADEHLNAEADELVDIGAGGCKV